MAKFGGPSHNLGCRLYSEVPSHDFGACPPQPQHGTATVVMTQKGRTATATY